MARSFFDTPAVPTLWGVIIPFLVLDFVIVGLRFYVRRRLRQSFLADDWLMIPSLIGVTGLAVMYFYGLGTKALGYRWSLIPEGGVEDMLNPDYVPVYAESTNDRIMLTRRVCYSFPNFAVQGLSLTFRSLNTLPSSSSHSSTALSKSAFFSSTAASSWWHQHGAIPEISSSLA